MSFLAAENLPKSEIPTLQVYAFAPPRADATGTTIRDFSDQAQASIVDAYAAKVADPDALRKALTAPLAASASREVDDRTKLSRTLVVAISKGLDSQPGDRLVRTVVSIVPVADDDNKPSFEFAGYNVATTDNRIQDIARIEEKTDLSLTGSLTPKIGGFGDNRAEGSVGSTRTTTADIVQQYEHLHVDITPAELVITRESERGLDVVGNTLVALTLAGGRGSNSVVAYSVSAQKLFEGGKPLDPDVVTFLPSSLSMFTRKDLKVKATLTFVLRRIKQGREYYTEGKQVVELVNGVTHPIGPDGKELPDGSVLIRASDAQPNMFIVCGNNPENKAVMAETVDYQRRIVLYESLDEARSMAAWLKQAKSFSVGSDGVTLVFGKNDPLRPSMDYRVMSYSRGCSGKG